MVHSDWLVILRTFVHCLLESNLQPFCNYASNHLELTFKKLRSLIRYASHVPADH